MQIKHRHDNLRLVIRALTPSAESIVGCILSGTLVVALHIFSISVRNGTLLPNLFDGNFALYYTNYVVQPVLRLINSGVYLHTSVIALWCIAGLVFYAVLEFCVIGLREWKDTSHETTFSYEQRSFVRYSRLLFLERTGWRLLISALALVCLYFARGLGTHLLGSDNAVVASDFTARSLARVAVTICAWALLVYTGVVLLRLYTRRTRLMGDDTLY